MRSTSYLFSQSTLPSSEQATRLVSELEHILGKRILSYPPTFREFGIGPNTSYKHKKLFLGLDNLPDRSEMTDNERKFMQCMANKAAQAQKANWSWRIVQEAEEKQEKKWYPFFVTLTIDPKKCVGQVHKFKGREVSYDSPRELWENGREFRLYIRSLAKTVASVLKHPPPHKKAKNYKGTGIDYDYRPESDYVTYAGVLEHGKTNEHHHAHIMLWLREIPPSWKIDPNLGRSPKFCKERECKYMRAYWPWSIDSQKPALYYRTKGDIWSELGHVTPIDGREQLKNGQKNDNFGKPIEIKSVQAVGNYVTKYMQKGTKVWNHRMKCTRNLGMKKLQQFISTLTVTQITALSWKPQKSSQLHSVSLIHSVPQGILRSLAKRKIFSIKWEKKQLDLKTLMKTNYGHYTAMLKSVRAGARPDRMHSLQFYDWVQQHLPEEEGFCEKRLFEAHKLLRKIFPKQVIKVQPINLGANNFGFTRSI